MAVGKDTIVKEASEILGDKVKVICSNVDLSKHQITFALLLNLKLNKMNNRKKRVYGKTRN